MATRRDETHLAYLRSNGSESWNHSAQTSRTHNHNRYHFALPQVTALVPAKNSGTLGSCEDFVDREGCFDRFLPQSKAGQALKSGSWEKAAWLALCD